MIRKSSVYIYMFRGLGAEGLRPPHGAGLLARAHALPRPPRWRGPGALKGLRGQGGRDQQPRGHGGPGGGCMSLMVNYITVYE